MKQIVLIGASGFVGTALLQEALERDIQVKAVVRHPEKMAIQSPLLQVVQGDVSSSETVSALCKGYETVVSAYNPGWSNPAIYEETLTTYQAILEGVKRAGVKRLLCVGGAGTLFVKPGIRMIDTETIPDRIRPGVESLGKFYLEVLLKEKEIDWVFFSPAGSLDPGQRTGKYRLGKDDLIVNGKGESHISVQDYAKAMIDEAEKPVHHQERFTIGY